HVMPRIDRSLFNEILVVDGHSTDGTVEYCQQQGLKVLFQPNKVLFDAQEHGLRNTTSDVIVIFSPDGNALPEALPSMCEAMREGYDIVVGSRYCAGAKSEDDDFFTAFGNRFFTGLINLLFGAQFTDALVGLRAYRRDALQRMDFEAMSRRSWLRRHYLWMNSWEVAASCRAPRLGLKVKEVPASEPPRVGGVRKLSILRNGLGALVQILCDFLFYHPPRSRRQP
ncbi:MAG: glycosyltransferase family 2 protein, partial [Verrucomicrobiae bacterium]|nr:glycosyltransferase family 2 protein [Verrucomicrobiae bacterium]